LRKVQFKSNLNLLTLKFPRIQKSNLPRSKSRKQRRSQRLRKGKVKHRKKKNEQNIV
jgi:hypothetical protein